MGISSILLMGKVNGNRELMELMSQLGAQAVKRTYQRGGRTAELGMKDVDTAHGKIFLANFD